MEQLGCGAMRLRRGPAAARKALRAGFFRHDLSRALAIDTLRALAEETGKIGRLLAFWDVVKVRTLAWDFAGTRSAGTSGSCWPRRMG